MYIIKVHEHYMYVCNTNIPYIYKIILMFQKITPGLPPPTHTKLAFRPSRELTSLIAIEATKPETYTTNGKIATESYREINPQTTNHFKIINRIHINLLRPKIIPSKSQDCRFLTNYELIHVSA